MWTSSKTNYIFNTLILFYNICKITNKYFKSYLMHHYTIFQQLGLENTNTIN